MKFSSHAYEIIESLQYGLLYIFASFLAGISLDFTFPHFDEKKETLKIVLEVLGQCLLLVIFVYLIRLGIKRVPLLFPVPRGSGYIPFMTNEYEGEMMMAVIFVGIQLNLVYKIDKLSKEFYEFLFNEERTVTSKL